jgi:hypothetical protein
MQIETVGFDERNATFWQTNRLPILGWLRWVRQ